MSLKEKLKALKADGAPIEKIETLDDRIREEEKIGRIAEAKTDAIDAAVFDLKAVNPNAVIKVDERTQEEVIRSIEEQGKIVADALTKLRPMLT